MTFQLRDPRRKKQGRQQQGRQKPRRPAGRMRLAAGTGFLFAVATLACITGLAATYYYFVQHHHGPVHRRVRPGGGRGHPRARGQGSHPVPGLAAHHLPGDGRRRRSFCHGDPPPLAGRGIAVAACIGANIATQVLKDLLPARPYRGVVTLELNSLPSGHTTLAASAAAAVFLMSSPRWRPLAGFVGGTFAIASGMSTLVNQWHRPGGCGGGVPAGGRFMIPAGWLILRNGGHEWNVWDGFGGHWGSARLWIGLPVVLGLASAAVAVYSLVKIAPGPARRPAPPTTSGRASR